VSVLCASRPRHPYLDKLATRCVLEQIDLDDAPSFGCQRAPTAARGERANQLEAARGDMCPDM
jgi:hypothetical protein